LSTAAVSRQSINAGGRRVPDVIRAPALAAN
jgi:hypothetical protein